MVAYHYLEGQANSKLRARQVFGSKGLSRPRPRTFFAYILLKTLPP